MSSKEYFMGILVEEMFPETKTGENKGVAASNTKAMETSVTLFELKDETGIELTFEDIDQILEMVLDIARTRYA